MPKTTKPKAGVVDPRRAIRCLIQLPPPSRGGLGNEDPNGHIYKGGLISLVHHRPSGHRLAKTTMAGKSANGGKVLSGRCAQAVNSLSPCDTAATVRVFREGVVLDS